MTREQENKIGSLSRIERRTGLGWIHKNCCHQVSTETRELAGEVRESSGVVQAAKDSAAKVSCLLLRHRFQLQPGGMDQTWQTGIHLLPRLSS